MNHPRFNNPYTYTDFAYPLATISHDQYLDDLEHRALDTQVAIGGVCLLRELSVHPTQTHYANTRLVRILAVKSAVELPRRLLTTPKAYLPLSILPMSSDPRSDPNELACLIKRDTSMVHAQPDMQWQRPPEVGYLLEVENQRELFDKL